MSNPGDEEFSPSAGARSTLQWAYEHGASTLGEAYDLLDQLEVSNDIPEVLGHDDTVEGMREDSVGHRPDRDGRCADQPAVGPR